MTTQISARIGVLLVLAFAPVPAFAQISAAVGSLGEAVNKKLDQAGAAVDAAGKGGGKGAGKEATASVTAGGKDRGGVSINVVTKQDVVLEIGLDVLGSFSAGLAAEAEQRDLPAKRGRCVANLATGHQMTTLMSAR